jgi:hypothetical protein
MKASMVSWFATNAVRSTVLPLHDEAVVAMRTNQLHQLLNTTTVHQTDSVSQW